MSYRNLLFISLLIFNTFACKRQLSRPNLESNEKSSSIDSVVIIQKTQIKPSENLIKDSSLLKHIQNGENTTTYFYQDTTYLISHVDSLQWKNIFKTPTPTNSFWISTTASTKPIFIDTSRKLLSNIRIALDAGHLAGTPEMAEVEGKLIALKHPLAEDSLFFYEGELTYLTVKLLKDSLEQLGAKVFVTRRDNESAFGYTYFEWLDMHFKKDMDSCLTSDIITLEDYDLLREEKKKNTLLSKKIIFHKLFKHLDFYQRALLINNFRPDITVIVHYNVDVSNKGWNTPTTANYNMAFVPGAFMEGEIEKQLDFNHFVRLSQTNEIAESVIFSNFLLLGLKKHTKVDIIDDYSEISYLNNYCLPTTVKGVFSRNLALTRQIKGTISYIEALYQDNTKESLLLNETGAKPYYSERVKEVSEGILEGIVKYLHFKKLTQ